MRRLLVVGLLLLCSGCGVTIKQSSRGMLPVIPDQPRPTMAGLTEEDVAKAKQLDQALLDKINENFKRMHLYALQLETGIKQYNEYATKNNALVREENGLPDPLAKAENKPKEEGKK